MQSGMQRVPCLQHMNVDRHYCEINHMTRDLCEKQNAFAGNTTADTSRSFLVFVIFVGDGLDSSAVVS
jgi:hypothetical protein